ncbi:hypothetical protein LSAT2_015285 [Lamellibrachia satsuma]|nr:hypothetical protein LSAT2_015285 [Lamellibrachia satsuma]
MGGGVSSERNKPKTSSPTVSSPGSSSTSRRVHHDFQEIQFRHASDVNVVGSRASPSQPGPSQSGHSKPSPSQPGPSSSGSLRKMDPNWEETASPDVVARARSNLSEFELPQYENTDDIILETFFHQNGKDYQCMYQSGRRFYLDSWQTQQWLSFPEEWKKQGILTTNTTLDDQVIYI